MRRFFAVLATSAMPFTALAATISNDGERHVAASMDSPATLVLKSGFASFDVIILARADLDPGKLQKPAILPGRGMAVASTLKDPSRRFYGVSRPIAASDFKISFARSSPSAQFVENHSGFSNTRIHKVPVPPAFLGLFSAMMLPIVCHRWRKAASRNAYRRGIPPWRYGRFS